jgi:hypothetical protein
MITGNALNLAQLPTAIPMIFGDPDVWVKPHFGGKRLAINMHMTRFLTIVGIEVKTIRSKPECRWHDILFYATTISELLGGV